LDNERRLIAPKCSQKPEEVGKTYFTCAKTAELMGIGSKRFVVVCAANHTLG